MKLYINCCLRKGSRTNRLAKAVLQKLGGDYTELKLYEENLRPLDSETLNKRTALIEQGDFGDKIFDYAKQFKEADEIVIAAPFWNYDLPAVLHTYLELVCTQGITLDIDDKGVYGSCCKARKLTFITTAGGFIPENDPASTYLRTLCDIFFQIKQFDYIKAEGLDVWGADVDQIIREAAEQ